MSARDAAEEGDRADLSGTAALLEIARVVAASHLARTVTFASVSGGSGGEAGMRDLVKRIDRPVDAVIEIGDLGGESADRPQIVGWSGGGGAASIRLQRTVSLAVRRETGLAPGFPLARTQLARLAVPLSVSGQGVALDAGLPSVRLARGGELPSGDGTPVSAQRLAEYGQAVVGVLSALDGPLGAGAPTSDLTVSKKILPAWAMRLLAAALLLPAGLTIFDGLMRQRRRGGRLLAHLVWVLALAVPFAAAVLLARVLGVTGAVPDLAPPAPPGAVPVDAAAWTAMGCSLAALVLCALVVTPWLTRRAGVKSTDASAGLVLLLTVLALALVTWISNPYAALLLVLPLNLWLLVAERDTRLRRSLALALVATSLAPVALVVAVYASDLSMSLTEIPWFWLLAVSGGQIGVPAALCWSLAAGTATGAVLLALRPAEDRERPVTVRGPLTYAGPGSLGGTESAIRR